MSRLPLHCLALLALALLGGCIPYAVGTTPQTVTPGERTPSVSTYLILNGVEDLSDSTATRSGTVLGADNELRFGLTTRSDIGVRVPNFSGIIVNFKHRLYRGDDSRDGGGGLQLAVMPGAGFVNLGEHAHVELTLLASAAPSGTVLPYGGFRGMQVFPLTSYAVRDSPTLGGFFGLRIGTREQAVSPEVGLYYDRSALELRSSSFIVVPSVTLQGVRFRDLFF